LSRETLQIAGNDTAADDDSSRVSVYDAESIALFDNQEGERSLCKFYS